MRDPNWEFNYHALRWIDPLWTAYKQTHDKQYRSRYVFLLRDWVRDNPYGHGKSRFSWNDHSTAWRGVVYACALQRLGPREWLDDAVKLHGRVLADDDFYVHHGNHALNQAVGLLALGCELPSSRWRKLAVSRIERLVRESVDSGGVINEQAFGYQYYNYARYSDAIARMDKCGMTPSAELRRRVNLMPSFIAFAALPNGRMELVGDTLDDPAPRIPGTEAEYVATGGAAGPKPEDLFRVYPAGYALFRSGWGDDRPLSDETAVSVRFGPGRAFHGHRDAASVTLYANGDRILLDPGMFRFTRDAWRAWGISDRAHNTVTVDGESMADAGKTELVAQVHGPSFDFVQVRHEKISDVVHTRRVLYSRRLGILVVDDDLRSSSSRTFRQWWHLHPDAEPRLEADAFYTGRPDSGANAWVVQLTGRAQQRVERGEDDPIQGWVFFKYGHKIAAPVVDVRARGEHARYVTLIVPGGEARGWTVHGFTQREDGYELDLENNGARAVLSTSDGSATETDA